MALGMISVPMLCVVAGYESGHTFVFTQQHSGSEWQIVYQSQPHTQPVLSLCLSVNKDYYITSSADATVAKHPLPSAPLPDTSMSQPVKVVKTKHSGQQGLSMRSDGKIFATGGWDSRVRIYSSKTMKEVAVLKWHKLGCYATAFAGVGSASSVISTIDKDISNDSPCTQQMSVASMDLQQNTISISALVKPQKALDKVAALRDSRAQTTHWLAAGSKDGMVSLWDIF